MFDDGERAGVWVNAADDPDRCALFLPAVHRRDPVIVAVSTEGTSPALAGWLRDRLAAALPPHLEELVAAVGAERDAVRATGRSTEGLDWRARIEDLAAALDDRPPPERRRGAMSERSERMAALGSQRALSGSTRAQCLVPTFEAMAARTCPGVDAPVRRAPGRRAASGSRR